MPLPRPSWSGLGGSVRRDSCSDRISCFGRESFLPLTFGTTQARLNCAVTDCAPVSVSWQMPSGAGRAPADEAVVGARLRGQRDRGSVGERLAARRPHAIPVGITGDRPCPLAGLLDRQRLRSELEVGGDRPVRVHRDRAGSGSRAGARPAGEDRVGSRGRGERDRGAGLVRRGRRPSRSRCRSVGDDRALPAPGVGDRQLGSGELVPDPIVPGIQAARDVRGEDRRIDDVAVFGGR